ncbi:unnamed protein product [Pleuronectes platessa]|uniref:Ig-like domain-containing protein n=1 Tax=Pleuronectes platessa TaxID=8262 RepID=A0A9N7TY64_PLEPL|nr:unnamed protein product [Pleuronectes platessa]
MRAKYGYRSNTSEQRPSGMADSHGLMTVLLIFLEKLLLTDSKVIPDTNVTCLIQDECILPCSFQPTSTVVIHCYYYNKDQFGLQNKHFSGRTCLFNSHIPHGNASLLLRRVKVQDRGMYRCYTSTRKGNQEIFINLEVKALIQSVVMEMTDEVVTCSSHNIYPVPQVTWTTAPASAQGALGNSTIKTTDHKGLFTVESSLRILGNHSNHTYFCTLTSADKTQVWTASRKNQEDMTQEEGHALSIPCVAPHTLQNFSLTWTFAWEGQADLDQDLLQLGDGSLLLHKPDSEEHSGTYTCTISGLQSRHVVQTRVNITVAPISVDEQRVQRSWWSTAASAAFVLFTIIVALPQCVRQRAMEGTRTSSHRCNGAGLVDGGPHKALNTTASYIIVQHGVECNRLQLQFEVQDELAGDSPKTAENFTVALLPDINIEREEKPEGPPEKEIDGLQSRSLETDGFGSTEPGLHPA